MRDRQAGAAVDLNGIANMGVVHEGFRLIRTEDASRRVALTTRLRSLTQARIGGSISQRSGITDTTAPSSKSSFRLQLMFEIHRSRTSQRGMQSSCYRRLIYLQLFRISRHQSSLTQK